MERSLKTAPSEGRHSTSNTLLQHQKRTELTSNDTQILAILSQLCSMLLTSPLAKNAFPCGSHKCAGWLVEPHFLAILLFVVQARAHQSKELSQQLATYDNPGKKIHAVENHCTLSVADRSAEHC